MIHCPTCGSDMVYSPVPSLFFCLQQTSGDNLTINIDCDPWIPEDAPAEDLLNLTENISKLAIELRT